MGDLKKSACIFLKKFLNYIFYMITTPLSSQRTTRYRIYRLKSSHLQAVFICSDDKRRCQLNILDI